MMDVSLTAAERRFLRGLLTSEYSAATARGDVETARTCRELLGKVPTANSGESA